jgi:hypothetical protein
MPNKECKFHPTLRTTATRKLVARLCSVSILYALEASLLNKDGANNVSGGSNYGLANYDATMMIKGIMQFLTLTKGTLLSQTLGGDNMTTAVTSVTAAVMVAAKVRTIAMGVMVVVTAALVAGQWR